MERWKNTVEAFQEPEQNPLDHVAWEHKDYVIGLIQTQIDRKNEELTEEEAAEEIEEILEEIDKLLNISVITDSGGDRIDMNPGGFLDVLANTNNYNPNTDIASTTYGEIEERASTILTVITNVGMILAVLMSAILGVKYMLCSVEEKAEYKKDMIPYLVGAVLVFGICTIVKVLQQIGQSINNI